MNILFIDDEWPSLYSGKALRVINIAKRLNVSHRLHFLYFGNTPQRNIELIKDYFISIKTVPFSNNDGNLVGRFLCLALLMPGDYWPLGDRKKFLAAQQALVQILEQENIDIIHIFSYFTAQFAEGSEGIGKIWDVGDSLYLDLKRRAALDSSKRGFKSWLYAYKVLRYERKMIKNFNKTVFVSQVDADIHQDHKDKVCVIPNGVDLDYFQPINCQEDFPSLVFTGHMKFHPNVQAVFYFVKSILPLIRKEYPGIKFYVVGAEPTEEILGLHGKKGVYVTGAVEDIRPYLGKASIFVAPMVNGGGIKNKLLQAMAMEKPVVSTRLGAEAFCCKDDENLVLVDSPLDFAKEIIALLRDEPRRKSIARKGRELVVEYYNWDNTAARYETLYRRIQESRGANNA